MRSRRTTMLAAVTVALALFGAVATAVPAHADGADAYEYVGRFYAPGPALNPQPLVDGVLDAVDLAGSCPIGKGHANGNYVGDTFYADVWSGIDGVSYVWTGDGQNWADKHCADSVRVTVKIIDTAPQGNPVRVPGKPESYRDNNNAQVAWGAYALVQDRVDYYYYPGVYARGDSVVSIEVNGQYLDKVTKTWVRFPCVSRGWKVTPTPAGPIYGDGVDLKCGA